MNIISVPPPTKNPGQRSLSFIATHDGCGIYCIKNLVDGKTYIGQSTRMLNRMREHKWKLHKNKHDNIYLQRAYNKYGSNNFKFYVLCYCEPFVLDMYETSAILSYRSSSKNFGYNLELGGNGKSKTISDETRKKQHDSHVGKIGSRLGSKWSDEQRKNYSLTRKGMKYPPLSQEMRDKLSKYHTGLLLSNEVKEKISFTLLGRKSKVSSSKYSGVTYNKTRKKFLSQVKVRGKVIRLGAFECEVDAAIAYDDWAFKTYGKSAKLNFSRGETL